MSTVEMSTSNTPNFEKLIREDLRDFMPYASARSEKLEGSFG